MKKIITGVIAATMVLSLSGCMGQMGLSQSAIGVNMKLVDNRFGRATVYLLASPIYAVIGAIDLVIFNSVEFWTGTNPYTGKSAIVDTPVDTWMKVDDSLSDELKTAPISDARMYHLDGNTVALELKHIDGSESLVEGRKVGERVDFYLNDELVATMTLEQIKARVSAQPEKVAALGISYPRG